MDIDPKERIHSFQVPDVCAKFRRNWFKIATVRARTDTQTHTYIHRDHTSDLIICPMLCYSNGTDNKSKSRSKSRVISAMLTVVLRDTQVVCLSVCLFLSVSLSVTLCIVALRIGVSY